MRQVGFWILALGVLVACGSSSGADAPAGSAVTPDGGSPPAPVEPTCTDGIKNGAEKDTDCGGGTCAACEVGKACTDGNDCAVKSCIGGVCQAPTCTDGIKNGTESDLDCGGSSCKPCDASKACAAPPDCASGVCTANVCQTATCTDTVKNGTETDSDCGGSCGTCVYGKACKVAADCSTGLCRDSKCSHGGVFPLYVFPTGNTGLRKFDATGAAVAPDPFSSTLALNSGDYRHMAFDAAGNLYVPSYYGKNIQKVDAMGAATVFSDNAELKGPEGIVFDRAGNMFVSLWDTSTILKITPGGDYSTWASDNMDHPSGIAIDPSDNIYVVNAIGGTVAAFQPSGQPLTTFGTNGVMTGFSLPIALTIDRNGALFVGEATFEARIMKIAPGATAATEFAKTDNGNFRYARELGFDQAGDLYVLTDNTRISKFDSTGAIVNLDFIKDIGLGFIFTP